jgi:hypothetical protein
VNLGLVLRSGEETGNDFSWSRDWGMSSLLLKLGVLARKKEPTIKFLHTIFPTSLILGCLEA